MIYHLYCEDVSSDIPLDRFGIPPSKSTSSTTEILFIHHHEDESKNYLNHQTKSNKDYGYYFIEDIALFEVYSGKKIVIKYFNEIDDDLIHSLLNYPFAILFSQRNNYVIHASSVLFKNKVFCFCGKSQAGKSSLASYLIKLGGSLISEDTCVFDYRDNKLLLLPSYNFIKISDEINEYQNKTFKDPIKFFKKSTDRKGYLLDNERFYKKPIAVNFFIYLQWSENQSNIEQLNNENSLKKLLSNEFISYSKENALYKFKAASKLTEETNHFLYTRKKKLHTLKDFTKIFEKKFL